MLYYVTAFKDYLNTYHRCNLKKKDIPMASGWKGNLQLASKWE